MNYKKIIYRAKQFGGLRLAVAYIKMGMGFLVCSNVVKMVLGQKNRDEAYSSISRKANEILQKKYKQLIIERKSYYDSQDLNQTFSPYVWTSWLQGFERAPELVLACVESMKKCMPDREIVMLSLNNYKDYVDLPEDIVKKFKEGKIPPASFSDLLRLELLIKFGGTWMDATVLCTQGGEISPKNVMDCNLFVFQTLVEGDNRLHGISTWFMSSCSNNRHLMVLRDVLIQYWRDYNCCLDYYIIHDFFISIAKLYPEEINLMPRKDRLIPLKLMERMGDKYDDKWMKELLSETCFHKLNYRLSEKVISDSGNFYHAVISMYL